MSGTILKNQYGEVVYVDKPSGKAVEAGFAGATPSQIADSFIQSNMEELGLKKSRMGSLEASLIDGAPDPSPVISISREKDLLGAKVVVYEQSAMGLSVFNAAMGVVIDDASQSVVSIQSSVHGSIDIANSQAMSGAGTHFSKEMTNADLKKILGISLPKMKNGTLTRQVIYRFEAEGRLDDPEDHEGGFEHPDVVPFQLAPVPDTIKEGMHYIVNEILFEAQLTKIEDPINWRALVEPETGAVLYIRPLVAHATALVYARDPQTQSGANVSGASSNAQLNPFRTSETLLGLTSATPQPLSGEFVKVVDISSPQIAPPEGANPASALNFNVRSDNFSAVNAYYHCDKLFRTMQGYGFNISSYFNGTTFPVPVDHRGKGSVVNADAPGNTTGNGLGMLRFGLLQNGEAVGIATSNRVVWHEFGHGLLWDNVGSPNFGFAHSAGDGLAAIFNDPASNEPDRGHTFPWVNEGSKIDRRHDRTIADGWAWFGPKWNTQYGGEQVLSTTLFRIYQSLGGASSNLNRRKRASELTTFLIFKAIGLLSSTTPFPEVFEGKMEHADRTTASFKGVPGGAVHKVIRWAFEKQGLFQPGATPGAGNNVNTEGNPPDVDVYIDDGRHGEYQYLGNHWSCQDMWVRRSADSGLTHQQPLVGVTNYMYVRVKNRGLQKANNVRVDAYHCLPGTGLAFPDDWSPMATATLPASGPILPGGEIIVGPFAFVPTQVGHECLLAIARADGDEGNDTTIMGTVPEHRLVPFDNNIGQRNVNPIYPSLRAILDWLREHLLWIRNPFKYPVVCEIRITLPKFMSKYGWEMKVSSRGGPKFELGPRARRKTSFSMEPGNEITKDLFKQAIARGDNEIKIETYIDGELSGGMSYPLSFEAKPNDDKPPIDPNKQRKCLRECMKKCMGINLDSDELDALTDIEGSTMHEILRSIGGGEFPISVNDCTSAKVKRSIKSIRFEIDYDDDA